MISKQRQAWLALALCAFAIGPVSGSDGLSGIADRQAITQQIAEYAYRWDKKDASAFAELFTQSGTIDWVIGGKPEATSVVGKKNIEAYAKKAYKERLAGKQSRHHFTNIMFMEISSDRAVTKHMMFVTHHTPGSSPENVATGYYRTVWTKTDDEWLIDRRTLYLDR